MLEIKLIRTHDQDEDLNHLITELMYNKLKRRIKKQGKSLSPAQTENLKLRSKEAYAELKNAWKFDFVLPNHDGEDSEHWNLMPYPIGDARISLHAFADLLQSGYSDVAEKWDRDLIP